MEASDRRGDQPSQAKLLLTVDEAAKALNISRASLYPLLMRKEILSIRVGGLRRIPMAALLLYIDELLGA